MFGMRIVPLQNLTYEIPAFTSYHPQFLYPAGMIRIENHLETHFSNNSDSSRDDLNAAIRLGMTHAEAPNVHSIVLEMDNMPIYSVRNNATSFYPNEVLSVLIVDLSTKDTSDLADNNLTNEEECPLTSTNSVL
jgi:hypothetical protein